MSLIDALLLACLVLALLAIVAWASAWKTMEWLGDAEDLLEQVQRFETFAVVVLVADYKRRTPRRST